MNFNTLDIISGIHLALQKLSGIINPKDKKQNQTQGRITMPDSAAEIYLDSDEELSVIRDGIKVVFDKAGGIQVFGTPQIHRHPKIHHLPSKEEQLATQAFLELNSGNDVKKLIGKPQGNGLIFAGISPETKKPFFTKPFDEPLHMQWNKAQQHAKDNSPLRIPKPSEAFVLYAHRKQIGHFNETSLYPESWYWTDDVSADKKQVSILRFGDGYQGSLASTDDIASLRLICD